VNTAGILYYNQLIDALIDARIEPVITLNYWDLPQEVINIGGWTNNITVNLFNDFAELCFQQFGDRVSQK
jgi:6-phospho-beta-glucosidase